MKQVLFVLITVSMFLQGFSDETINGVNVPSKLKTSNTELTLNGAGIRKKAFFKVYVLGLYLKSKSKNADEIIKANEEMAVRLQITSSVVSSSNMSEAIREGFEKSLKGNVASLKSKIDGFIQIFSKDKIKEGDVFLLDYVPGVGIKSFKNGKQLATTEGEDFKNALFGIWLSANPVDAGLKTALLGN